MDWQSILAIGVAVLCGGWVVWRLVQPVVRGRAGCAGCVVGCRVRQPRRASTLQRQEAGPVSG